MVGCPVCRNITAAAYDEKFVDGRSPEFLAPKREQAYVAHPVDEDGNTAMSDPRPSLTTLCVFCGSNPGRTSAYLDNVEDLATQLAGAGVRIVYGGAKVGAMGALADAALRAGGEVVGVIPSHQVGDEIAHTGLTELHVVDSMHDRKAKMSDLADGFVGLPGGLGTLEEFAEIVTWAQLGLHRKPTGLLNTNGYYDCFLAFLDHAVDEHFLRSGDRDLVLSAGGVGELLEKMRDWTPSADQRWRSVDESAATASGGVSNP